MKPAHGKPSITVLSLLLLLGALLCGAAQVAAAGSGLEIRRIAPGVAAKDSVDDLSCDAQTQGNVCIIMTASPGIVIPDLGEANDEFTLTNQDLIDILGVSNCVIRDLNAAVNLDHTHVGDLIVELERGNISPDLYFPPLSCSATRVDAIFNDEASLLPNVCPAVGGIFRPEDPLSMFDGRRLDAKWEMKVADVLAGDSGILNRWGMAADVQCDLVTSQCVEDSDTMCLNNDRFRVEVDWRDLRGGSGVGRVKELTPDTGYFWFFDASNVEVVIKVLNACAINNRFWVFAAGLTNVEVELRVTDTRTGQSIFYRNPLGFEFLPIQDTDAFATCP